MAASGVVVVRGVSFGVVASGHDRVVTVTIRTHTKCHKKQKQ